LYDYLAQGKLYTEVLSNRLFLKIRQITLKQNFSALTDFDMSEYNSTDRSFEIIQIKIKSRHLKCLQISEKNPGGAHWSDL
jgi:hypothetical protein